MDEQEVWKPITGFDGYEVSNMGNVRSLKRSVVRVLSPDEVKGNYLRVSLSRDGVVSRFFIHRLVMDAFIGPRPIDQWAAHNNGNPHDNRASNLRWATRTDNEMDKRIHGTAPTGQKNPCAKLSEDDARAIRNAPTEPRKQLAETYRVSVSTIKKIRGGHSWASI